MISVLIPTVGDRPLWLTHAMASVAEQRGVEAECVVTSDPERRGQAATLNRALQHAKGDRVLVLHDDDYLVRRDALAALSATLDRHPDAAAVYSLPQYVTADGKPTATPPALAAWMAAHPRVTMDTLADGGAMHGGGVLYRREWLERVGPWDEALPCCEEWEYHLRLLSAGAVFVACPEVTVAYRRHAGQQSRRGGKIGRRSARRLEVRRAIRARYAKQEA